MMLRTFIIADNQSITRAGLHWMIPTIMETAEVVDVKEKSELADRLKVCPHSVVVLDYFLFDFNGMDDFLTLRNCFPDVRWVLFSNEFREKFIRRMSAENDISMVLKENESEEIRMALKSAATNERYLCRHITNLLLSGAKRESVKSLLTATEIEILKLVAYGKSVKEIAESRVSSVHTVITHKKNIFRKIGVNNVHEATRYALKMGLVDFADYEV